MATNTTNNTLPCNTTDSLTTLILAVVDSGINVTSQIASCPDVCGLSWGEGNPDFSGIGANFSWILQALLTVLHGPVLGLGIYLKKRFKLTKDDLGVEELHKSFFQSLALVSLPVNLATLIYLRKTRFLFEATFLYWLNTMQVLSLCSTVVTLGLFLVSEDDVETKKKERTQHNDVKTNEESTSGDRTFLAYIGVFCCVISIAISLAVGGYIAKSILAFSFLPELVSACGTYGTIIPKIPKKIKVPPPSANFFAWSAKPANALSDWMFKGLKEYGLSFVRLLKIVVGMIAITLYEVLLAIALVLIPCGVVFLIGEIWDQLAQLVVQAVVFPLTYVLVPLGLSIGMVYCLVQMQIDRNSMRSILGKSYIDDQWGFGQIVSIFVWFQVIWGICWWLYRVLQHQQDKRLHGGEKDVEKGQAKPRDGQPLLAPAS
ncbi:hypothetical protein BKA61DRAFT_196191 [Leptodontidium sp. MPI-SDFR-AT-0119]|nr:hypothetical protein BKA61DRAFT_196191 [Leptodontidium sp. MPI-SDFR-AT-0119]